MPFEVDRETPRTGLVQCHDVRGSAGAATGRVFTSPGRREFKFDGRQAEHGRHSTTRPEPRRWYQPGAVVDRAEQGAGALGVVRSADWRDRGAPAPAVALVQDLDLAFLDVPCIRQQAGAKIDSRERRRDAAMEALPQQARQQSAMVDMAWGQQQEIDAGGIEVERPLIQRLLDEEARDGRLEQKASPVAVRAAPQIFRPMPMRHGRDLVGQWREVHGLTLCSASFNS